MKRALCFLLVILLLVPTVALGADLDLSGATKEDLLAWKAQIEEALEALEGENPIAHLNIEQLEAQFKESILFVAKEARTSVVTEFNFSTVFPFERTETDDKHSLDAKSPLSATVAFREPKDKGFTTNIVATNFISTETNEDEIMLMIITPVALIMAMDLRADVDMQSKMVNAMGIYDELVLGITENPDKPFTVEKNGYQYSLSSLYGLMRVFGINVMDIEETHKDAE